MSTINNQITSLALIGFGRIAEVLYGPCIKLRFQNIWVCEPNNDRHKDILKVIPHARIVSNLADLHHANDNTSFSFNLIPGPSHEETTSLLLEKGWNVFTEKPATISAERWLKLIQKAQENSLVLLSAPVTPYMPQVQEIKDRLDNGEIGDLSEVQLTFFAGGPARRGFIDETRTWFFGKESCVIRDLGPYTISCLIHLLGRPTNFVWKRNTYTPSIKVKPSGFIVPVFGAAAVGVGTWKDSIITVSLSYRPNVNDVEAKMAIVGSSGCFSCDLDGEQVQSDAKVSLTFKVMERALNDKDFWQQHVKQVAETIDIIGLTHSDFANDTLPNISKQIV